MNPHRSQTAGFFFPGSQLIRTGHLNAAAAWKAGAVVAVVLMFGPGGTAVVGLSLMVVGVLGFIACVAGERVQAHRAIAAWNTSADSANYEQWMAWQRAADLQRQQTL